MSGTFRMALGAQRHDILKLVIGHGMLLTIIGVILPVTSRRGGRHG